MELLDPVSTTLPPEMVGTGSSSSYIDEAIRAAIQELMRHLVIVTRQLPDDAYNIFIEQIFATVSD